MSIPKVVGIEQEYALNVKGSPSLSPHEASCFMINTYARRLGLRDPGMRLLWDYGHETPFQDIRGGMFGKNTGQEIIDDRDNLRINALLPNGARFYTDHAHPEYSTPECLSARDALACDKAGELILLAAAEAMGRELPGLKISIFKNNVDYQGHSYGCHENYLFEAEAHEKTFVAEPDSALKLLVPFLITRQILAGAGKVGGESEGNGKRGFQISQRADFLQNIFGLETMFARPIINTRGEHHADSTRFRRLHLILGDANMSEFAGLLKIGATQLVLAMIEDGFPAEDLTLADPVKAAKQISADFRSPLELANGKRLRAIDIQKRSLDAVTTYVDRSSGPNDPECDTILQSWAYAIGGLDSLRLSSDSRLEDDPHDLRTRLDWVTKLWLMDRYRDDRDSSWNTPALRVLDLQFHNISPDQGIYYRLQADGFTERVLDEDDIQRYVREPPSDTRAHFRGKCIAKFKKEINLINWEVVGFDHGDVHRMIPLLNPIKGTSRDVDHALEKAENSRELVALIQSSSDA